MNIFIIPSWYPSKTHPTSGIFVKEQVRDLASLIESVNFGISLYGQGDLIAPRKMPFRALKFALRNIIKRPAIKQISPNLSSIQSPAIMWNHSFMQSGLKDIIRSNAASYKAFEKKNGKVSLIHAHVSYPAGYVAYKLACKFKVPYIISEHMGPFPFEVYKERSFLSKITIAIKKANLVLSPSRSHADDIRKYVNRDISIIPNFISGNSNNTEYLSSAQNNEVTCLCLGGHYKTKGVKDLLKAIEIAKVNLKGRAKFTIAGDNNDEEYKSMASVMGISHLISWKGSLVRKQVNQEMNLANCLILPSHYESFGIVLIEAMSYGKPIIATKCGGPEDIVNDTNGLLVNPHDPLELSQAILKIVYDYSNWDRNKIIEDFKERFTAENLAPRYLEIYKNVALEKG